ncbi:type IV secretion system protein [Variovorax sp. ZT4R33]|uniref:type IV secretion system protein n=1 Tax=Variovorax sp. ZT4R33 TaxID=3443743 RepID=UPI003F467C16
MNTSPQTIHLMAAELFGGWIAWTKTRMRGLVAVIVVAATTMAVGSVNLQNFFTRDLAQGINYLVTGKDESPVKAIDENLAWTQVAMGAIESVKTPANDIANTAAQGKASLMAMLGVAGPPMTAGAMLLMYQMAMMLFIGLGPIFILRLLFDTTKPLFHNWVKYGIATLFAMAVLDFTTSIVMKLMLRVAAALWSSNIIGVLTGETAEGLSNTAMQQGGIGLILTLLIISAPPMAAQFFGGTLGQFQPFSQLGGAAQPAAQGPAGQAPGGYAAPAPQTTQTAPSNQPPGGLNNRAGVPPSSPQTDTVKVQ